MCEVSVEICEVHLHVEDFKNPVVQLIHAAIYSFFYWLIQKDLRLSILSGSVRPCVHHVCVYPDTPLLRQIK